MSIVNTEINAANGFRNIKSIKFQSVYFEFFLKKSRSQIFEFLVINFNLKNVVLSKLIRLNVFNEEYIVTLIPSC